VLINVDFPWNPMPLHQRIGRLDRHGQRRAVHDHDSACALSSSRSAQVQPAKTLLRM